MSGIYQAIQLKEIRFPLTFRFSEKIKKLIWEMLEVDPLKRFRLEELHQEQFFLSEYRKQKTVSNRSSENISETYLEEFYN